MPDYFDEIEDSSPDATMSDIADEGINNFQGACYLKDGFIKSSDQLNIVGIRKIAGVAPNYNGDRIIRSDNLHTVFLSESQYLSLASWSIDFDTEYSIIIEDGDNIVRMLCRPVLVYKVVDFGEKGPDICDIYDVKVTYEFLGLGFFELSSDKKKVTLKKIGDFCNLPIVTKKA